MDKIVLEVKKEKTIGKERYVVSAKLRDLGQGPYFSTTITVYELHGSRWIDSGGGADQELIGRIFPELRPFTKWHLVNVQRGPMHYVANSLYWAGFSGWANGGPNDPPRADYLRSTCIFGSAGKWDKESRPPENMTREELEGWLKNRFEDLMQAFDKDMAKLFGREYQLEKKAAAR